MPAGEIRAGFLHSGGAVQSLEQVRANLAKAKSRYYAGETDNDPVGATGKRWLLPPENDRRCLDTHPRAYRYSEWAFGTSD